MRYALCLSLLLGLAVLPAARIQANDITVSNVGTFIDEGVTFLVFDLSWKNSWRTSTGTTNHDAAWVFAKYKDHTGTWKHISLSGSHNNPGPFTLLDVSDGMGYFIFRNADGVGDVSITNIRIGIEPIPGDYEIRVFAVEMVYIPEGSFFAGDANAAGVYSASSLKRADLAVLVDNTLKDDITSDDGTDDNQLDNLGIGIDGDDGIDSNNDGIIDNPLYPTGYRAFYCMKYELSQRGFVDFLNTLTYQQQEALGTNPDGVSAVGIGDIVVHTSPGEPTPAIFGVDADGDDNINEPEDNEWSAARDLTWVLLAAWLDWAALRPMTDLEFEKICRGPVAALANEYVWGTLAINTFGHSISNAFTANELVDGPGEPNGNANYNGLDSRVLRCGIFATNPGTRTSAGAAFYGPMEMGGNVAESVVSLGNVAGRSFTAKLGDGVLTGSGFANVDYWPGINNNSDPATSNAAFTTGGVTNSAGIGTRGGSYADGEALLHISNRQHAALMAIPSGGRGVRHDPMGWE